jgi:hypothetical protein
MNNNDSYKTFAACLLVILLIPFLTVYSYLVNGYVLSMLWGWFIVTTFHLQPLTIVESIGLAMVVGFLTSRPVYKTEEDKRTTTQKVSDFITALLSPFLVLFIGWLIYTFWFVR